MISLVVELIKCVQVENIMLRPSVIQPIDFLSRRALESLLAPLSGEISFSTRMCGPRPIVAEVKEVMHNTCQHQSLREEMLLTREHDQWIKHLDVPLLLVPALTHQQSYASKIKPATSPIATMKLTRLAPLLALASQAFGAPTLISKDRNIESR